MCRGLGKIERKIIEMLEYDRNNGTWYLERWDGFISVNEILPRIFFDLNHWDKIDNNSEFYNEDYVNEFGKGTITPPMYQSAVRAIRSLEKKGMVTTKKECRACMIDYGSRGGWRYNKDIKLIV